jgi:hypothetical protein
VIGANPVGGQFQRGTILGRDLGDLGRDLGGGKFKAVGGQVHPVKPRRQIQHRRIPARPDICDDGGDGLIHILGLFALHAQKGGEGGLEIPVGDGKEKGHGALPWFRVT